MKIRTILLLLAVLPLASCTVDLPDSVGGGTLTTVPVFHDFDNPANSRTNPNATPGTLTYRTGPLTRLGTK
jgi:hypothetical protein